MIIVSDTSLHPLVEAPDGAYASETVPGLKVAASPAEGVKCERCWCLKKSVGDSKSHPALCSRCVSALEG